MTPIRFVAIAPALLAATLAQAGDDRWALSPAYVQECGACHVAYPPALLPRPSWQRLMNSLDKHYGSDASLDAAARQSIGDWLQANAGSGKRVRVEPPQDRITLGEWFVHKHRKVARDDWARPAIKTASNCGACHQGAAEGDYDEHRAHIPR